MSTLPIKDVECISFVETRGPVWAENATAIGITSGTATTINADVAAAREAYTAQQTAQAAAKAATTTLRGAMRTLRLDAGNAIRTIRAFAIQTNDSNVYAKAQIPPPAVAAPALPPTQPTELRAIVETTGALTIEFKPLTPAPAGQDASTSGVVYFIKRKLASESAFTIIGATPAVRTGTRGMSTYTDATLPGGGAANNVQYVIQGQRASTTGPSLMGPSSAVYTVMLGTSGGLPFASVREDGPGANVRMAA